MKISRISLAFIIISSISLALSQEFPSISLVSTSVWFSGTPEAYKDGIYYYDDHLDIFFTENNTYQSAKLPSNCNAIYLSQNIVPYTFSAPQNYKNFAIIQMNQNLTAPVASFPVESPAPEGSQVFFGLGFSGNYLVLQSNYLDQGKEKFNYFVFDSLTNNFTCSEISNITFENEFDAFVVTENSLIFVASVGKNEATINTLFCSNGSIVHNPFTGETLGLKLFLLNNSYLIASAPGYVSLLSYSNNGSIILEEKIIVSEVHQINTTHFIAINYTYLYSQVLLYTVSLDASLMMVNNFSILTGINKASYSKNTNLIWVNIMTGILSYNINTGNLVSSFSDYPPIVLNNGSVLNLTIYGYFLQNPGESQVYFVLAPNSLNFAYFPETNQFASIYMPSPEPTYYSKCSVLVINQTNNNITQNDLMEGDCPGSNFQSYSIKDLSYDSNGDLTVTYRDGINQVYIISKTSTIGPLQTAILDAYASFSINLTSGIGIYSGFKVSKGFESGQFYLKNGSIISSFIRPGGLYGYSYKLTERYFLFGAFYLHSSTFMVYDSKENRTFGEFSLNVTFYALNEVPFIVLGVEENSPTVYQGIVCATSGYKIALINAAGGMVEIEGNGEQVSLVNGKGNTFWVTTQATITTLYEFKVIDWSFEAEYLIKN